MRSLLCLILGAALVVGTTLGAPGCGVIEPPPPPAFVPEILDYVVEHATDFKRPPEDQDPLADASFETVVDPLSGIHGCWGSYVIARPDPTDPLAGLIGQATGNSNIRAYTVRHFDLERGIFTDYDKVVFFDFATLVSGTRGSVQVVAPNQLRFEYAEDYSSETGAFVVQSYAVVTEEFVILDGNQMRVRYTEQATPSAASSDDALLGLGDRTFFRFECPASDAGEEGSAATP